MNMIVGLGEQGICLHKDHMRMHDISEEDSALLVNF